MVHDHFQTTHWSLVGRAAATDASAIDALNQLLVRYLPAMVAYLVVRRRFSEDAAEDIVQGYVADKILEKRLLASVDRSKGRFRSLLIRTLDNYAIDRLRKRDKISTTSSEPIDEANVSQLDAFDRQWAAQTFDVAIAWMRDECETEGRAHEWAIFRKRLLEPALSAAEPVDYGDLVRQHELSSAAQASNLLMTAKRRFQRLLHRAVTDYADNDHDLESEMNELWRVASAGPIVSPGNIASTDNTLERARSKRDDRESHVAALADQKANLWTEAECGEIFESLLSSPIAELIGSVTTGTLGDLLRSTAPNHADLVLLKEAASASVRGRSPSFAIPSELGSVVYFLAIAKALASTCTRISESDDATLLQGFSVVAARPWLPADCKRMLDDISKQLEHSRSESS
ncbi:MAG: hypothetical protein AAFU85_25205 [Planctomycetota bacterium]